MHLNDDFFLHTLQRSLLSLLVVSAASILTSSWDPINENRMKIFLFHSDKFLFSDLEFTRKGLKMKTNNHSF